MKKDLMFAREETIMSRQTDRPPRKSNVELLRVVAMLMIVAHHFSIHGGFDFPTTAVSFNRLWTQFILLGGKIGVNVFVLISGYFLISAKTVKASKVIKLWSQIFFYSVLIFFIFVATGIRPFGIKAFLHHLAPITYSQWWFAAAYFVLYLLSPYLNGMLNRLNQREYVGFLSLLLFCWCLIPTFTSRLYQSNNLLWFIFLYSLAGYFRLYGVGNVKCGRFFVLSAASAGLTFLSAVVFDILGTKISVFASNSTFFYDMQKLPALLTSVFLFLGFLKLEIGQNRFINFLSSAMFGVYLIHDHEYVRLFLWETLFQNRSFSESNLLAPYSLFVVALVFTVCAVLELARIHLLEKKMLPFIERLGTVFERVISLVLGKRFNQRKTSLSEKESK